MYIYAVYDLLRWDGLTLVQSGHVFRLRRASIIVAQNILESSDDHHVHPFSKLPSGKHRKNYGKSQFSSWVNPLFLWPWLQLL